MITKGEIFLNVFSLFQWPLLSIFLKFLALSLLKQLLWYKKGIWLQLGLVQTHRFELEMGSDPALCLMLSLVEWVELLQLITARQKPE